MDLENITAEFERLGKKHEAMSEKVSRGREQMHADFVRMQKQYNEAEAEHAEAEKGFEAVVSTINTTAKLGMVASVVTTCALVFVGALLVKKLMD